jgi:protein-tyrosine phosphatase
MAEYIMKKKLKDLNLDKEFSIVSRATSYEEQGNDIYPPAKRKLEEENIPYDNHYATRLEPDDYQKYDYFICMEERNITNSLRIFESDPNNKIIKLLDKDIADPWYTGNFDITYSELDKGLNKLIELLIKKNKD